MIRGEPVTAVIPVRGGSKGIPGKNLYELGGESLLVRTIKLARSDARVDRVLVSTDHPGMYDIAARLNAAAPGLRPVHLATDSAKTADVVADLAASAGIAPGYVLLLQVTTPLRTRADLKAMLDGFEAAPKELDAVVSLVEHDAPHPDKLQSIQDGRVKSYLGRDSHLSRQLMPKVYALNGAFYLTRLSTILEQRTFIPDSAMPFVMPPERSVNLDGPLDLLLMEALVEKGKVVVEQL